MDNGDPFFLKQRKSQVSKSVESLESLMSDDKIDANSTDLHQLIFDQDDNKKGQQLIDKHQQTASNSSLTFENACWFVLSIVCIYISDIFNVLMFDQRINR